MKTDLWGRGPGRRFLSSEGTLRFFLACTTFAFFLPSLFAQNVISTVAGGGNPVPGNLPTAASLGGAGGVVGDAAGNLYVSSFDGSYVFKVSTTNQITVLAGTGYSGYGVNGPALNSPTFFAANLAIDATGSNLFVPASGAQHIFEVNITSGALTNIAGSASPSNPFGGFSGDGGPATQARLNVPMAVAVFGNNVYIADSANNRVRVIAANGTISTLAGSALACPNPTSACGDGGAATQAMLNGPSGVAVDGVGNVFISDTFDNRVREVNTDTLQITTIAGTGSPCDPFLGCGDGGLPTNATLNQPSGLFVDTSVTPPNIYIVDEGSFEVREIQTNPDSGLPFIETLAGNGNFAFSGDGGAATAAALDDPTGIFVQAFGYTPAISERGSSRVREVDFNGDISSPIGGGSGGDGGTALNAVFAGTHDVALDAAGDVFLIDHTRVREIAAGTSVITTVAGNGTAGFGGDGGPGPNATLNVPFGIAVDRTNGNLFIADNGNNDIRTVQNGVISTYAGLGTCSSPTSPCGDGEPASDAQFNHPRVVVLDNSGNVLIADVNDNRVREVNNQTTIVSTVAGTGNPCPVPTDACGDGGQATLAQLTFPSGIAVDAGGNILISDSGDNRIRRVDAVTGVISTLAFNGRASFAGDGGAATAASMAGPGKLVVDSAGNIFVSGVTSDQIPVANLVVRRIDAATGTVTTVAGNPKQPLGFGFSGDGGAATSASIVGGGLAITSSKGLYIADSGNNRIRFVQLSPTTTLAPTSLDFGKQSGGIASPPLPVTLTNSGSDDLLITSIVDANEFSETNNCPIAPKPLAPGQLCTINIKVTPSGVGVANDTLTITDNAPGSPHTIPLTATGTSPFQLTTNCTSLSVVPGQSAIYSVSLTPAQGFTQSVKLTCTGVPALAACTVNPSSVTLDGATTVQAQVTATTTPATSGFLKSPLGGRENNRLAAVFGLAGVTGLGALVLLPGKHRAKQGRRLWVVLFCLCMLSTMMTMSSCGGGSGAGTDPPGTAVGTYPLTVTGTFQSATGGTFIQSVSFNLVVQ